MRTKSVYVVVGKSWFDTSSYSVSSYYYFISQHRTMEAAQRKLARYADSWDYPYVIFEVEPKDYEETIAKLKHNRELY